MARKRFNPDLIAGPHPTPGPARREQGLYGKVTDAAELTVSEICAIIQRTLEDVIPSPLRVVGEVSNLTRRNHWYFSLKDENAVLSCVAWASSVKRFKFEPADGQQVVVSGHVSHYPAQGRTQFYVSSMQPVGAGALELRFRALCEELRGLGYFDDERKRPLPLLPRRIAVITSRTGAAVQDVISTAAQRCPAIPLLIVDVRVQGDGAAEAVAAAIRRVNRERERLGVDAILVTRGGGSIEDLWAFNERIVADATLQSELPVVAAIGHESDTTIIELVADVRAATPTQSAMRLIPSREELVSQLVHLGHRLRSLLQRRLEREVERVAYLARREFFLQPSKLVADLRERLDERRRGFRSAMSSRLGREHLRVARLAHRLEAVRPVHLATRRRERVAVLGDRLHRAVDRRVRDRRPIDERARRLHDAGRRLVQSRRESIRWHEHELKAIEVQSVLRRGFSYTTLTDGRVLRSIREVDRGDRMTTHVADGTIDSTVGGSRTRRPRRRKSGRGPDDSDQLDLFSPSG